MSSVTIALDTQAEMLERLARLLDGKRMMAVSDDPGRVLAANEAEQQMLHARGRELAKSTMIPLATGATFYVSEAICDLIGAGATALPDMVLRREDVPVEAAFWYLAKPVAIPGSTFGRVLAFSWLAITAFESEREEEAHYFAPLFGGGHGVRPEATVLRLVFWMRDPHDDRLVPVTQVPWPFGHRLSEALAGEARLDAHEDRPLRRAKMALAAAACVFVRQRIAVAAPAEIDRATRRRAAAAGVTQPTLQVITLRERVRTEPATAREIEWACRWIVSGHWRNQRCGAGRQEQRPTWILPHIKGPEDKPLRPSAGRLFAVVR